MVKFSAPSSASPRGHVVGDGLGCAHKRYPLVPAVPPRQLAHRQPLVLRQPHYARPASFSRVCVREVRGQRAIGVEFERV